MTRTLARIAFFVSTLAIAGSFASPASFAAAHTSSYDWKFGVSGPLTLIDGNAYWGGYFTALTPVSPELSVGGETGFMLRSSSFGNTSVTSWVIPLLLTGIYRVDQMATPTFTPFVGAGIGAGIIHASVSSGVFGGSDTSTKFEGLIHLGAKVGVEQRLFADVRLGTLDGNFVFAPTVGWYF